MRLPAAFCLVFFCAHTTVGDDVYTEIQNHKAQVQQLADHILKGPAKGRTHRELGELTDKFGPRLSGSQVLEESIEHLRDYLNTEGYDNVHLEPVKIQKWTRGAESARIIEPKFSGTGEKDIDILGLGSSVGTPQGGIEADVLVVRSFDELTEKASQASGKIVVYNNPWTGYSSTVPYRSRGATEAAKVGAVAALIKSVASGTMYTPHTGQQGYDESVTKIPAACLTVEDVEMLQRMSDRNETIRIKIEMGAENYDDFDSNNLIADITGTKYPDEVVFFGGHIDSWDVGQGVMDDGGGIVLSYQVLKLMKELDFKPKRTMRFIAWTGEEQGLYGGIEYHRANKDKITVSLAMENDNGLFTPHGIGFSGSDLARSYMAEIMKLLTDYTNATQIREGQSGSSPDVGEWINEGIPAANIWNGINDEYFYYHHTNADMLTVYNPDTLDKNQLIYTTVAYVVANLEERLPLTGNAPVTTTKPSTGAATFVRALTPLPILMLMLLYTILTL